MSVPRQAFKKSLRKLYDYLDVQFLEGGTPLPDPDGQLVGTVLGITAEGPDWTDSIVAASIETDELLVDEKTVKLNSAVEADVDGALATQGLAWLTKGSAGAYTLALPGENDNGQELIITSGSAFAHVVVLPDEQLWDGTGTAKDTMTFAAQVGASIHLVAVNQTWHLVAKNVVTLTDAA